ncbi:major facilitator superfamily MFS-1 [Schizophyllum commune H4-8]|nr:major facilitator superfamily MFS-1 [Schizophyllum commune H4-8]KAI5887134.1 major facilitator superfamily MFS-1 [Schizophyllum commune H4-8]
MSVRGKGQLPRRSFGGPTDESALDVNDNLSPNEVASPRTLGGAGRVSFGTMNHRPSFLARWRRGGQDEESAGATPRSPMPERPPIPSMIQPANEPESTPLPKLSMIVFCITMLGEFLCANVCTPFLLFMVESFGETEDEAEIAFNTGVLVSVFFLTQFLTSLLWATIAQKHGTRIVLTTSLLGSAATVAIFGTSTSLKQALCVRLLQGIFGGAVGVARGSVAFITDPSNEGRAYAILGFCWGFGGVAGAIIGGTFERPADKWPETFASIPLFTTYPYLLPSLIAASITFIGSFLSLFLGPNGGPREGAIQLPPEKLDSEPVAEGTAAPPSPGPLFEDLERPTSLTGTLKKKISQRLSGILGSPDIAGSPPSSSPQPPVPLTSGSRMDRRTFSRTSRANGSAYGYSTYRNRVASSSAAVRRGSTSSSTLNATLRRASMSSAGRRRRGSNWDALRESDPSDMNFAQRLLMANENAVTHIADLWVAAAMNVDNEEVFESESDYGSDEEGTDFGDVLEDDTQEDAPSSPTSSPTRGRRPSSVSQSTRRQSTGHRASFSTNRQAPLGTMRRPTAMQLPGRTPSFTLQSPDGHPTLTRRASNTPTIFSHAGVKTPPAVLDAQQLLQRGGDPETPQGDSLAPILESRGHSVAEGHVRGEEMDAEAALGEKSPSLASQLPILVIVQYGLLALHSTTHDQLFMSYLVTDYKSGGLNLTAGHFAQLIALMCLAQIAYQFVLYPNIGPPRGRFSHLAMFRIGSFLFIPSYLVVVLFRVFASEGDGGNFLLMTGLAVSMAVRFCGATFGYTAVSVLLNYMTPPQTVSLANGIAQSIVSLARFFGPILGGTLWSVSTEGNPGGYWIGFACCAGFTAVALLHSFFIR